MDIMHLAATTRVLLAAAACRGPAPIARAPLHTLSGPTRSPVARLRCAAGDDDGAFTAGVTLEDLRREQRRFADERDWAQFHTPRNLAQALVGEVGELCELLSGVELRERCRSTSSGVMARFEGDDEWLCSPRSWLVIDCD